MKLRNLMYATMIACAFASCSKEDDPVINPDGGDGEANATLEVMVANAKTKAFPTNDESITSLKLVVFDGTTNDSKVEVVGTTGGKAGANASVKTQVKAGNKRLIVLANVDADFTGKTYSQVLAMTQTFEKETASGFSMNSKVYSVTPKASATTYLGYTADASDDVNVYMETAAPIQLYRNVAKIILTGVTVESAKTTAGQDRYPGASAKIKEVFLLHAHKTTTFVGGNADEWGAINMTGTNGYVNGSTNVTYAEWVSYMTTKIDGTRPTPVYPFIEDAASFPYSQALSAADVVNYISLGQGTNAPIEVAQAPFYAYENTEAESGYRTLLVVKADFSYTDVKQGIVTDKDRYYPIAVGYGNGLVIKNQTIKDLFKSLRGSDTVEGVIRNLQYEVSLKITGPGYKTPFGPKPDGGGDGQGDTFLDAQVQVVPFGLVEQPGEVE